MFAWNAMLCKRIGHTCQTTSGRISALCAPDRNNQIHIIHMRNFTGNPNNPFWHDDEADGWTVRVSEWAE